MSFAIDAYRTRRLVFRKPEFPVDDDFFDRIMQDPVLFAQTHRALQQPIAKTEVDNFKTKFTEPDKAMLAVLICLPKEPAETTVPNVAAYCHSIGRTQRATTDNSTPIGVVFLGPLRPNCAHHRNATLGIHLELRFTGQGYGSEAIEWMLRWAFQTAGMHRVELGTFGFNHGAIKFYEGVGFVREGCKREAFWIDGKWCDGVMFGMLEGEWRARYGEKSS